MDPRLLTLAVVSGCSASPHYAGAQDVFVAEELRFIPLHRDTLAPVPISKEGEVCVTGESLHLQPWGIKSLGLLLESGEVFQKVNTKGERETES